MTLIYILAILAFFVLLGLIGKGMKGKQDDNEHHN